MENDKIYMKQALAEANEAYKQGEIPIGAVVTAHAEMQAITSAAEHLGGKYLNDCTLYVTIEPCVMCAGALGWSQISRIVYGAPDEKRGYSRFAPNALHPRTQVTSGVMAEECAELMQRFFQERR